MSEKRTAAEIEAELKAMRETLTSTVDELATRVNPATKVAAVKESAMEIASGLKDTGAHLVAEARKGDGIAIATLSAAAVGAATLAKVLFFRSKH